MVLFFAHILFVVNRAFSATPAEELQQFLLLHEAKETLPYIYRITFCCRKTTLYLVETNNSKWTTVT